MTADNNPKEEKPGIALELGFVLALGLGLGVGFGLRRERKPQG